MKFKLIIVIIISAIMLAGGILELIYITKTFNEFEERLEELLEDILADEQMPLEKISETRDWLEKKHKGLEFFIPHIELNELSVLYNEMMGAAVGGDKEGAVTLLYRLKEYAIRLQDVYSLRFQTIV